jgi:hypothetical protein
MVAYSRSGHFGRTRTLNPAAYCASMSTVSAGQQRNGQVAGVRDTVYGSEGPLPAGCLRSQRQSTRLADEQGYDQVTWLTL